MIKKDPTQVAAVEKAVAEKYGKDAVQDFRSTWSPEKEKEYLSEVKKLVRKNTKILKNKEKTISEDIVIRSAPIRNPEDRACPVCKTYSFSGRDDLYMNRYTCCYLCYYDFVLYQEESWKNGERPSKEHFEHAMRRRNNG